MIKSSRLLLHPVHDIVFYPNNWDDMCCIYTLIIGLIKKLHNYYDHDSTIENILENPDTQVTSYIIMNVFFVNHLIRRPEIEDSRDLQSQMMTLPSIPLVENLSLP